MALLLISSGSRLNEALAANCDHFDLEARVWKIPVQNSKSKKVRFVPLNDMALSVLEELKVRDRTGAVFVNPRTGKHLKTLHKAWGKIRAAAGLPHLRIHDLRHNFASFLANSGVSMAIIGETLGHCSSSVTQRYIHLTTETLLNASAKANERLQAATPKLLPMLPQPDAAA